MQNNNKDDLFLRLQDPVEKNSPTLRAMRSLLYGDEVSPVPVLTFTLPDKSVIFGIRLAEVKDSFLVGLPAKLYADNETVIAKEVVSSTVIRLWKSSVLFTACSTEDNAFFYLRYVATKVKSMPDYFTETRVEYVNAATAQMPDSAKLALHHIYGGSGKNDENSAEEYDPHEAWKHMPYNKKTIH